MSATEELCHLWDFFGLLPSSSASMERKAPASMSSSKSVSEDKHKDVDRCLETLRKGQLLSEADIKFVCEKLSELLLQEGNIRHVQSPVTVVGDVHGYILLLVSPVVHSFFNHCFSFLIVTSQYYDVLELFKIGGEIPETNYLFLGDYVDRGHYSLETISLLACLKLRYPDRVTLIRGNHESRQTTMVAASLLFHHDLFSTCIQLTTKDALLSLSPQIRPMDFMPSACHDTSGQTRGKASPICLIFSRSVP